MCQQLAIGNSEGRWQWKTAELETGRKGDGRDSNGRGQDMMVQERAVRVGNERWRWEVVGGDWGMAREAMRDVSAGEG